MKFQDLPKFIHSGNYQVDVCWSYLNEWLDSYNKDGGKGVDLDPDFQREHVWDDVKRVAYVEYILRGGESSYILHWNIVGGPYSGEVLTIVDGKQRLEAVRKFLRNELVVFDGHKYQDFTDKLSFDTRFKMHVNGLDSRAEVLRWYLQLNEGGVVHTEDELEKVRKLLSAETKPPLSALARRVLCRPQNYNDLPARMQWQVDKDLGILDWDGK